MADTEKNIELELRAEVSVAQLEKLSSYLSKEAKLISTSKRLSVMFLGKTDLSDLDIRVRIDSHQKTEMVVKKGDFHADNRIEISQKIQKDQFVGMVKFLSIFGFKSKVTERENTLFDLGNGVQLVLVKAGDIAYVEIEKMSNSSDIDSNRLELLKIISELKLTLVKDGPEFYELCDRLTKYSDWQFDSSVESVNKLEGLLAGY